MNFLGHLYLAGHDPSIRFGNFIADHIKGIPLESFPQGIKQGIIMHRAIDYFTDSHPAMAECRQFFRSAYQKYAGVVLDAVLDHFLCTEWTLLSPRPLRPFIFHFYLQLLLRWYWLPPFWKRKLPTLIRDNRIYRYRKIEGICESLDIMARTTSLPQGSELVREVLSKHYEEMRPLVLRFLYDIVVEMQTSFAITPIGWNGCDLVQEVQYVEKHITLQED
ncbi:MAG: ACP phosphodiesterase [Bacteroides sp.]